MFFFLIKQEYLTFATSVEFSHLHVAHSFHQVQWSSLQIIIQ